MATQEPNPFSSDSSSEEEQSPPHTTPGQSQDSSSDSDSNKSSFSSDAEAIDDLSLAPSKLPLKTLADARSLVPDPDRLPDPIESLTNIEVVPGSGGAVDGESSALVHPSKDNYNLSCAEEAQTEEEPPSSPSYCVRNGLSNYDSKPSHLSWPSVDSLFYIQEAKPSTVVSLFLYYFFLVF